MPQLRYKGSAAVREISSESFQDAELGKQESIRIDTSVVNEEGEQVQREVTVSAEVAEFLLRTEPDDWELTDQPVPEDKGEDD